MRISNLLAAIIVIPSAAIAAAVGHGPNHNGGFNNFNFQTHSAPPNQASNNQALIHSEKVGLTNAELSLRNAELNGNPSQVKADRTQIAALQNQIYANTVRLYTDGSYSYVHRQHDLSGWGDNSGNSQHFSGWGG